MIVTRKACKCALCTHEWLPSRTRSNPKADPRKVKRCASCKSFAWNSDDPKLLAERLAKVELPTGTFTGHTGPTNFPEPGTTEHWTPEQQEAERQFWAKQPPRLVAVQLPVVLPVKTPKVKDNTSAPTEQYEAIMVDSPTPFRPPVVKSTICRHRVLLAHCELCNAVTEARP